MSETTPRRPRWTEPMRSFSLLERVLRPHVPPQRGGTWYVADLMTPNPICIQPDDTLRSAWEWMEEAGIRHLPVVDEEARLVGILSHRDLLRHALAGLEDLPGSQVAAYLERIPVHAAMVIDPETTEPRTHLADAGLVLWDGKLGCLPVVEGEQVVGILTEADFVRLTVEMSQAS